MAPAPRPRTRLPLLCAAVLACAPTVARADAPEARETAAQDALARLASPVLVERRRAVQRLVQLLPGSRPGIIAALERAPWVAQLHLVEVLSHDGGPEATGALLTHLVRADETQAGRIRTSLARDGVARARLLDSWRADPAGFGKLAGQTPLGARRVRELVTLLRRGEIEALFVARKSRSGSTGYYKGQYEALLGADREPGYREQALAVVTGIALDEAIPTPGLYRSGVYRCLEEHHIDEWELKSMALNAVGELCTPKDEVILARLEGRRLSLRAKWVELEARLTELSLSGVDWESKRFQDAYADYEDVVGDYLDQVACLYQVLPDRYDEAVEELIQDIRYPEFRIRLQWSAIAGLLIRVGWYERAVEAYQRAMGMTSSSPALGYYNQACAYAQWSNKAGLHPAEREEKLDTAMRCLEWSAQSGWSDVDWMNEDRDLDPLREHRRARYDVLVERIRKEFDLPR